MIRDNLLIGKYISIRDAISQLVIGKKGAIFIVDEMMHLQGIFTNGDMRKILISNIDLSQPIENAMNKSPIVFNSQEKAIEFANNKFLIVYPLVKDGVLFDALFPEDIKIRTIINNDLSNVPLVLMAGGKGTRLYPRTEFLPKALIQIGGLTISERIIDSFRKYGCKDVYFILNHKAKMIESFYNDKEKDYCTHFYIEKEFLNTAGGLYLVKNDIKNTFVLSNCDILVEDDLSCAYRTHKKNNNDVTIVCSSKNVVIPYGVIKPNDAGEVLEIIEKPQLDYLVNTGVYVVEPTLISLLNDGESIGMPDLILRAKYKGMKIGVFPISEKSWFDMGQIDEMNEMIRHFEKDK